MAAIDVAGVVRELGGDVVPVVLVGTACLMVYVVLRAFKWLKLSIGGSGRRGVMTQAESDQADFDRRYAAGEAVAGVDFVDVPAEYGNVDGPAAGGRSPMPMMTAEESAAWRAGTWGK